MSSYQIIYFGTFHQCHSPVVHTFIHFYQASISHLSLTYPHILYHSHNIFLHILGITKSYKYFQSQILTQLVCFLLFSRHYQRWQCSEHYGLIPPLQFHRAKDSDTHCLLARMHHLQFEPAENYNLLYCDSPTLEE